MGVKRISRLYIPTKIVFFSGFCKYVGGENVCREKTDVIPVGSVWQTVSCRLGLGAQGQAGMPPCVRVQPPMVRLAPGSCRMKALSDVKIPVVGTLRGVSVADTLFSDGFTPG